MIIAVCGRKRHGKDTVGRILIEKFGYKREYFAKPLKEAIKSLLVMTDDQVEGDLKEVIDLRYGITPRQAMQTLGTECGRDRIHKNIWALTCFERIKKEPNTNWVITDLRFLNEADIVHQNGGIILRVERPGVDTGSFEEHQSEQESDKIKSDFTLLNIGTIPQLEEWVEFIVTKRIGQK